MNQPYYDGQFPMQYAGPVPGQAPGQPSAPAQMPMQAPVPYQPAFHAGPYPYPAGSYPMDIVSPNTNPMPWAGPYHDPSMGAEDDENILLKKVGPMPVWGWALTAAVVGGVGFVAYKVIQNRKQGASPSAEAASSREDSDDELQANLSSESEGWSPSRSGFVKNIEAFLKENKIRGVKCYVDADDAAKYGGIKAPSPLINMRVPKPLSLHTNPAFVTLCAAEGLKPIETVDGIVGLYPDGTSERGAAWENYIDLLRNDGLGF